MFTRLGLVLLLSFSPALAHAAVVSYQGNVLLSNSDKQERSKFRFRVHGRHLKGVIISVSRQSLLQVRGKVTPAGHYRAQIWGDTIRRGTVAGRLTPSRIQGKGRIFSQLRGEFTLDLQSALSATDTPPAGYEIFDVGDLHQRPLGSAPPYWYDIAVKFKKTPGPSEEYQMTVSLINPGFKDLTAKFVRLRPTPTVPTDPNIIIYGDDFTFDSIRVDSAIVNETDGRFDPIQTIDPALGRSGALTVTVSRAHYSGITEFRFTLSCTFTAKPPSGTTKVNLVGGSYSGMFFLVDP